MASRRSLFFTQGGATINGLRSTMTKLQNVITKAGYRSTEGMVAWLEYVREDMDRTPPLIPEDTKDLADSWYIYVGTAGTINAVEAGFTAPYAPYVHERMDPGVQWTRPQSGPKFFEKSVDRNMGKLFESIRIYANVDTINPVTPPIPPKRGYRTGETVILL